VARAELGNKHTCLECGVKFYDLNKDDIICPVCETKIQQEIEEPKVRIQTPQTPITDQIIQDEAESEPEKESLDKNLEGGVIEDDNPIIMDDDDILDDETEEELINENDIDIPDIENEELIEDDDNDFLFEEDDIEDSDLIITPKSDDD
jgi:hypothetical protein